MERLEKSKQQMIKGLFFDFDGVITIEKQGSPTIISYISKETNIPYETVNNAYCKHNHELFMRRQDWFLSPFKFFSKFFQHFFHPLRLN